MDLMKLFRARKKLPIEPLKKPVGAASPPVRSMTMPNGKVVRVMRDDVFQHSVRSKKRHTTA